ncbi:hypothetical protein MHBO_003553, partial [Bonamia ostreae]
DNFGIENAEKLLKILQKSRKNDIEIWILSILVHLRQNKIFLAIRAFNKANEIDNSSFKLWHPTVKLSKTLLNLVKTTENEDELAILKEFAEKNMPKNIEDFARKNVEKISSVKMLVEAIKCQRILNLELNFDKVKISEKEEKEIEDGFSYISYLYEDQKEFLNSIKSILDQ